MLSNKDRFTNIFELSETDQGGKQHYGIKVLLHRCAGISGKHSSFGL